MATRYGNVFAIVVEQRLLVAKTSGQKAPDLVDVTKLLITDPDLLSTILGSIWFIDAQIQTMMLITTMVGEV